jgi:hypothetical protein
MLTCVLLAAFDGGSWAATRGLLLLQRGLRLC